MKLLLSALTLGLVPTLLLSTPGDLTQPDVIVARRTAQNNTFFPAVERLKDGELVVVYYESPAHTHYLGRVALVRSRDRGRSWSAPVVVVDRPGINHRDPSITRTTRGTLLVSYFLYFDQRSLGVFVVRSKNNGHTWSKPIGVGSSLDQGPATSARIVELDNGDLVIPMYGRQSGDDSTRSVLVRSRDDGRTWPMNTEVDIAHDQGIDFVEPALADLGGGNIVAVMRTERAGNEAYEARSVDHGKSWTHAAKTSLFAQASDLLSVRLSGWSRPLLVHSWGDWSGRYGEGRPTVIQLQTTPAGEPIGSVRIIYHGHCGWGDESYPSTVQLNGHELFTVFYDACAGYIGGRFTNVNELIAPRTSQP